MHTVNKLESLIKEDILLLKAFVMRISVCNINIFSDIVQEIDDIFKNLFHSHTINFHCCSQLVWILQNSIIICSEGVFLGCTRLPYSESVGFGGAVRKFYVT